MDTASKRPTDRIDSDRKFYTPAASISAARSRVESALTRYLGGHGRVLIPDTYNQ
jgi:hypothetical protein